MGKGSNSERFKSREDETPQPSSLLSYFPKPSRGSPLMNTDIKILTIIANLDHKQLNGRNCGLGKFRNIGPV
ncbi:Ankyrin Repeat And Lem Domain-Containing Protein 2 [Manis pentadactyla]|nr:Ankyrin Repeat And Lem Domain-Containing Protein 2 [Manis pentadactyla]